MIQTLTDWCDRPIQAFQSRGGVWAFKNFEDGMMKPEGTVWPPAEVIQKICRSDRISAFHAEDIPSLTEKLGFYTDLQSAHSEDAMVWSYFGTISRASASTREKWAKCFFGLLGLPWEDSPTEVSLWRRVTHPDSLGSGGPELDALIITHSATVVVEAKWRSGESRWQGVDGRSSQMQLRDKYLREVGARIFGSRSVNLVSIVLEPYGSTGVTTLPVREVTWAQLVALNSHPSGDEVTKYYDWKRNLIPRRYGVAAPG